jgi:type I restriction enzyme S subunit
METPNLQNLDKSTWQKFPFGEIAKSIGERVDPTKTDLETYVGLEHIDPESLHIKRFGKREDVSGTKLRCYPGDIIFGRRRAYQRKAAICEFDGFCSAHALVLRANPEVIDPKLFPFFLHSDQFMHRAIDISVGGLSPTINWTKLKTQEFLLPPKDQQAKLAELLWAADGVIEKHQSCKYTAMILRKTITMGLLNYGYSARTRSLPEGWEMKRVKDFATIQSGATPARSTPRYFDKGTIPWVKTLDLRNSDVDDTEEYITEEALRNSSCKIRPIGTVLVAMYGGFNQIGRTGILKVPAATNQALAAIMINDERVMIPEYLLFIFNAKVDYWKRVAISSRKDPNITKTDVEFFPVPIPPIETQKAIVAQIEKHLGVGREVAITKKSSNQLLKSLINQIF